MTTTCKMGFSAKGIHFFTLGAIWRENSAFSTLNRGNSLVKVHLPDTLCWTMKKYSIPASKKLHHQKILQPKAISFWSKHTTTTPQQDQEGKLLFWHQTVLCSCLQVGRYTQPVIFILHRKFSLFMALIPTWFLQSYLPQLYISLITSSTS